MSKAPEKRYAEARSALEILAQAGFRAMLAGGCVRDRQLGLHPKDYDVATDAKPEQVCLIFKQKGLRVIPTGIDHGTVSVLFSQGPVEITTLRQDVVTDGRHAVVEFGHSFEEDAKRRDFTINAMFEDKNGQVFDYFEGLKDLKRRVLKFVGDPRKRICEDYLRIMRLFRFWARFGFEPEVDTLEAIKDLAHGLERVSQERLTSELLQMLSCKPISKVVNKYISSGVSLFVTPGVGASDFDGELFEQLDQIEITRRDIASLACLLKSGFVATKLDQSCERLKLSRRDRALLALSLVPDQQQFLQSLPSSSGKISVGRLMEYLDSWEGSLVNLEKTGFPTESSSLYLDYLYPLWGILYPQQQGFWQKLAQVESSMAYKRRQQLPVSGKDITCALHIEPGPELGLILRYLKRSFRDGLWTSKPEAMAMLKHEDLAIKAQNYLKN